MQYAIFFVSPLTAKELRESGKQSVWQTFQTELRVIAEQNKQIETLSESAWLIPLQNGLLPLSQLTNVAEMAGFERRVLLIDGEPNWLK